MFEFYGNSLYILDKIFLLLDTILYYIYNATYYNKNERGDYTKEINSSVEVVVDEFEVLRFVIGEIGHVHHHPEDYRKSAKEPAKDVEEPLPGVGVEVGGGHGNVNCFGYIKFCSTKNRSWSIVTTL